MNLKLNTWQTILLFAPFIIGAFAMELAYLLHIGDGLQIANVVFCFAIPLVLWYQVSLVISFNNAQPAPSKIYVINALIPAIGLTLYFLYVVYLTIIKVTHTTQVKNTAHGPIKLTHPSTYVQITITLLIYAAVNYFFINNMYASRRLKKIHDVELAKKTDSRLSFTDAKADQHYAMDIGYCYFVSTCIRCG